MTFPVVATVNYSEETADTTTHDVLVPSGINAGELLLLFVGLNGNTATQPTVTGWTNLKWVNAAGAISMGFWYKFAAGGETNFTYTSSVSEQSGNRTWRVTGAHGSSPPEIGATGPSGFLNANSGNALTPTWGAEDTMWVIFGAHNGLAAATGYPTGYTDNQFTDGSSAFGAGGGLSVCSRNLNTATETPGDITYASSEDRVGRTVAIRPAVVTAGPTRKLAVNVSPRRW